MRAHVEDWGSATSASHPMRNRGALLITSDMSLAQEVIRELARRETVESGGTGQHRRFQLPIAATLEQARMGLCRVSPAVILLDALAVSEITDLAEAVRELAGVSPLVVLAARATRNPVAAEAEGELFRIDGIEDADMLVLEDLISAGRVEFVTRSGEFVPLVATLIAHRMDWRTESARGIAAAARGDEAPEEGPRRSREEGEEECSNRGSLTKLSALAERTSEALNEEFGETLRHEVNNPLTGILGNAELLLAQRGNLPGAVVSRLETIAKLAVRLRETIRRLTSPQDTWRDRDSAEESRREGGPAHRAV